MAVPLSLQILTEKVKTSPVLGVIYDGKGVLWLLHFWLDKVPNGLTNEPPMARISLSEPTKLAEQVKEATLLKLPPPLKAKPAGADSAKPEVLE